MNTPGHAGRETRPARGLPATLGKRTPHKNERPSITIICAIASAGFVGLLAYRLSSGIGGELAN